LSMSEAKWGEIIERARNDALSDQQIADIAVDFANSGKTEVLRDWKTADVASTGGPSSLSTLLAPLFLVRAGYVVPKLGVPGRPAGGLDVLAQIPGYRIEIGEIELRQILTESGYAHFISAGAYAPLDLEVFRLRQRMGAQAVPALVIASLLSKKIAVDVKTIGLDVRVAPHGNFGQDYREGRANTKRFIRVASLLDRHVVCVLTDATIPFQPYLGRGEAIWALKRIFSGEMENWLLRHVQQCGKIAMAVSHDDDSFSLNALQQVFEDNLQAQGTNFDAFCEIAEKVENDHRYVLESPRDGFVRYDLVKLRSTIVSIQNVFQPTGPLPDPIGVRLLVDVGDAVETGQPVMSVRVPDDLKEACHLELRKCFNVLKTFQPRKKDEVVYD